MFNFLAGVGQWFEAHELMSAEAGHWVAWIIFVLLPIIISLAWIHMIAKYSERYEQEPTAKNKYFRFVAYTAPVSVPTLIISTIIIQFGKKARLI